MVRLRPWFIFTVVAACGGKTPPTATPEEASNAQPSEKAEKSEAPPAAETPAAEKKKPPKVCEAQPDFRYEYIQLPPAFAPALPAGYEELYFAPGMFKAETDGYWSYVFALMWEAPQQRGNLREHKKMLDLYYKGLIDAVGKGKHDLKQVKTSLVKTKKRGEYFGTVDVFDAFTDGAKLQVKLRLTEGKSCVFAQASPKPLDHPIWQQLDDAVACLPCKPLP